jgi:heterodisulfide reductase subunit C
MDVLPHRFVSMVEEGNVAELLKSKSLWKCLSCFACVERCPRGVEPAYLIEAVRLLVIRRAGRNHMKAESISTLPDDVLEKLPQQLLVSAFRKYSK